MRTARFDISRFPKNIVCRGPGNTERSGGRLRMDHFRVLRGRPSRPWCAAETGIDSQPTTVTASAKH